ncbi:MAG TPA: hypothetical protein VFH92_12590, partial [Phenylobacterium sp.]|nr:hypothetical protein [Phenylobacterium sp.]
MRPRLRNRRAPGARPSGAAPQSLAAQGVGKLPARLAAILFRRMIRKLALSWLDKITGRAAAEARARLA